MYHGTTRRDVLIQKIRYEIRLSSSHYNCRVKTHLCLKCSVKTFNLNLFQVLGHMDSLCYYNRYRLPKSKPKTTWQMDTPCRLWLLFKSLQVNLRSWNLWISLFHFCFFWRAPNAHDSSGNVAWFFNSGFILWCLFRRYYKRYCGCLHWSNGQYNW